MSDTPKTDELATREFITDGVWIRHARKLERENAALRQALADTPTCRCGLSTDEQCALSVENAALRKDKERLDWMASADYWADIAVYRTPQALRAAIDAARKEAQP